MKPDPKSDPEITNLFDRAEDYLALVRDKLSLDPPALEQCLEINKLDALTNLLKRLEHAHPELAFPRAKFVILYLFPNLTESDRELLEELHHSASAIHYGEFCATWPERSEDLRQGDLERASAMRKDLLKITQAIRSARIEEKLSELQLRVLDTNFFDPDAGIDCEWS